MDKNIESETRYKPLREVDHWLASYQLSPHDVLMTCHISTLTSEISVTETIMETEMTDPTLTETETMVMLKTEIL